MPDLTHTRLGLTLAFVLLATGCGQSEPSSGCSGRCRWWMGSSSASPLKIVEAPTPSPRPVRDRTRGTYPQVEGKNIDLWAVNAALRKAFIPTKTRAKERYSTSFDPRLASASTVVVSALLTAWSQTDPYRASHAWLSATLRVPSGEPVTISELFADPSRGLRALGNSWRKKLRRGWQGCVARDYVDNYAPGATFFREFALTPSGLAAGVNIDGACTGLIATVPYGVLRPYLSKFGTTLIAGVRRPRLQRARSVALHGTGLVVTKALPGGQELASDTENTVTAGADLGFAVTVEDTGDSQEVQVKVTLTIQQSPSPIVQTKTIDLINPGEEKTVTFHNLGPVQFATRTTVKVDVQPVPDEKNAANNSAAYPVIFSLG
jgi:CARDB